MADNEAVLDMLDPYGRAMQKAREMNKNIMGLPQPPNTGSTLKDFLLNSMNALGGIRAPSVPMGRPPVTGGKDYGIMEGVYSQVHNPGSAMDLSLQSGVKPGLGTNQIPGIGAVENANKADPRIQEILNYLSNRGLNVKRVKDAPGGTSYITTENPTRDKNNEIRIRVPEPGDDHPSRGDIVSKYISKNGKGSFYDLSTKADSGFLKKSTQRNESGERYGDDLNNLYSAIDKITGKNLVPEGKGPVLSKPERLDQVRLKEPPKENLNMDDLIDRTLKNMEEPKYNPQELRSSGRSDTAGVIFKPRNTPPGKPANTNATDDWANHPNIRNAGSIGALDKDPTEMVAANTGGRPTTPDILGDMMGKTEQGKYQLEVMRQQLKRKGIDPTNMSVMDMFKHLNPDLFPK